MKRTKLFLLFQFLFAFGISLQNHAQCESTNIQTTSGEVMIYTCPGDGMDDMIFFENDGNGSTDYAYVATDPNWNILGIHTDNVFNFEGAGSGTCLVWGFSYTGDITAEQGDFLFGTPFSNGCFQISNNLVRVIRDMPDGGTIQNAGGPNSVSVCTTDPYPDDILFNHSTNSNSAYTYVITDDSNNILANTNMQNMDFSGVPAGVCRIWGLSYTGNLTLMMGANAATTNLSDDCFDLSDNFIEVTRIDVDGGTVADANGATNLTICAGDATANEVTFTHLSSSASNYRYIVTDENNNVLGLPPGDMLDFNGAGEGVCRVWGLSYTGDLTLFPNDNILNKSLSTDCYSLSENFIEVVRTGVDGGSVATTDGESRVYTCPGDGIDDIISFMHITEAAANYTYVITDEDGNVLGLPGTNSQNFEGAGSGVCLVWGLSYTGNILLEMGDNALSSPITDDCFALSENFIEVIRDMPDGGTVSTVDGATVHYTCPGNGIPDLVEFAHQSNSISNYGYVITDEDNNILGIPPGNMQNFDGAGTGVCRVWGLSYTGAIIASQGDNAINTTLTDGCFSLSSNFIEVRREQPDGGELSADGYNRVYTCPGDGMDDVVTFTSSGSNANFQLVITDEDYNILGLPPGNSQNFEGAGTGVCLAWGVAYTGAIVATAGDNIFQNKFSTDCWDFSNQVTIIRDTPDGGMVMNNNGPNAVELCTTDGFPNVISFSHASSSNSAYTYLITDDQNNILANPNTQDVDFEGVPPGVCRIWGLSYSGSLSFNMGDDAANTALSTDCYELSGNFIEITRTDVDGGSVAMPSGETMRYVCPQNASADEVMFTHTTNSPADYTYIVTTPDGEVLGLPPGNSLDFNGAPPGICYVWGLSYTGDLTIFVGDNIFTKTLSTDCHSLSENAIQIFREEPNGGTVSMPDGETTRYTCTQDGNGDIVNFVSQGASNSKYAYIITSPTLEILGIEMNDFHDFDGAPPGTCWVWGLAYTGNLTAQVGDQADQINLSDDCFDLSENFIEVIRDMPDGGTVSMPDGETTRYTCTQDGNGDIVNFVAQGASNSKYAYIITSPTLEILGIEMNDFHDFDGAPPGTCWVWGLAYTGSLTAQIGDQADQINLSDDCFNLSENFIEVIRDEVAGGEVQTTTGETVVNVTVGDGMADVIEFESLGASNSKFTYVITDDANNILGIPPGNSQDFEGAGEGICRVWGLAYTGNLIANMGDNAGMVELSDDCYSLSSNFIEINRMTMSPFAPNGQNSLTSNNSFTSFEIAPNPATEFLNIDLDKNILLENIFELEIYNTTGHLIFSQKYDTEDWIAQPQTLDISDFENGWYFLTIKNKKEVFTKRFLKQH